MIDYEDFTTRPKSFCIAPAGYGKTHTITECLKHTEGKQLILTHTHAGISSLKEKLNKQNIEHNKYQIETISGFAQKYVLAFYTGTDVPDQEDKNYFKFIIEKAILLFKLKPIIDIIKINYNGLFVDEYQDCTKNQHELILILANIFNTRIFGDHLQGIFEFNEPLVDLENESDMKDFFSNTFNLTVPWRWNNKNSNLGKSIDDIRKIIVDRKPINLNSFNSSIEIHIEQEEDIRKPSAPYYRKLSKLINDNHNLLLIYPLTTSVHQRIKIIQIFNNRLFLLESLDDKDFYKISKSIDKMDRTNIELEFRNLCDQLFSGISTWFNRTGLLRKKGSCAVIIQPLKNLLANLQTNFSYKSLLRALKMVNDLKGIKCYRKELFFTICKAIEETEINKILVVESMIQIRNRVRRIGRKVFGKAIGTTLLTKGLEFDNVIILNAHKFECPKNLYVTLTRASKRLIVFTNNPILTPKYP